MSYNGSGTFNINTAGQPVVTGTTITSTAFNLLTADLATGLSTALTKDGQTTPTANIPLGGFKITGLGAGTAATDAAQYGQLQAGATTIATVTGTDTYVGTLSPAIAAYATGNLFSFVAPNTNTGAATINLNSLGAKNITKLGSTALAAGDIVSGRVYQIEYDGTRFQLLNPSASTVASFSAGSTGFTPSSATTGAVTLAGTLATTNGGTGLTSFTANGVVYASSSSALATGSALTFDGTKLAVLSSAATTLESIKSTSTTSQGALLQLLNDTDTPLNFGVWGSTAGAFGVLGASIPFFSTNASTLSFANTNASGAFVWGAGSTPSEQMRLNSTGLGVGTSTPYAKIHATGTIKVATGNAQGILALGDGNGTTVNCGVWRGAANAPTTDGNYLNFGGYDGLVFATGAAAIGSQTERARIDSSGNLLVGVTSANANGGVLQLKSGITFPATAVAATDANTLDDYEEGTWTMGVSFGGGTTGITYNASYVTGSYTKIGNRVFISGVLVLTSKGSASGSALLTGLPFTSSSSASAASAFSQVLYNATFTGQQFLETNGGSTTAYLWQVSALGARSALTDANFANNSQITVGGSYTI
jgi:hypothetical protein